MRTFLYTACDAQGRSVHRQVRATDRDEALALLEQRGYVDIRLRDISELAIADPHSTLLRPGVIGALKMNQEASRQPPPDD